jgi:hypothetical protein
MFPREVPRRQEAAAVDALMHGVPAHICYSCTCDGDSIHLSEGARAAPFKDDAPLGPLAPNAIIGLRSRRAATDGKEPSGK